jgi:hypothetical protein
MSMPVFLDNLFFKILAEAFTVREPRLLLNTVSDRLLCRALSVKRGCGISPCGNGEQKTEAETLSHKSLVHWLLDDITKTRTIRSPDLVTFATLSDSAFAC